MPKKLSAPMPVDNPASTAARAARATAGAPASSPAAVPDRTLEIPMWLLGRTVKQTRDALAQLAPGQVLAMHTNDP